MKPPVIVGDSPGFALGEMPCLVPITLAERIEADRQAANHGRVIGNHAANHRDRISKPEEPRPI